jgi:TRAP-type C4-dicarboxylate transport system substrate-binding protein
MRKRRVIAMVAVLCLLALTFAGCGNSGNESNTTSNDSSSAQEESQDAQGSQDTQESYTFRLGTTHNDPFNPTANKYMSSMVGLREFFNKLDEYSNGRISVDGYYMSTLGTNPEMYQQVMMGELDLFFGQPMSSIDKRYATWNVPYLFENYEEAVAAVNPVDGPVFELSAKWLEEKGVKLLMISSGYIRGFINSKHEVRVPKDVADLKIRTYEDQLVTTFWSGLGTTSVISQGEMFSALQTKTVDAMELHPTAIYSLHMDEVTDYYSDIDWQWTNGGTLAMPLQTWNSLPSDIQDAINKAVLDFFNVMAAQEIFDNQSVVAALHDELGMTVTLITDAEREEWIAYARSLDDRFREYIGADTFDEYMAAVEIAKKRLADGTAYKVEPADRLTELLGDLD